ncbi:hypothetical protein EJ110_NYTH15557 [Nymphaea thermarum]|nr:hypothetical protein EJ110_NYTH15557 [Nymphaea thermarum]
MLSRKGGGHSGNRTVNATKSAMKVKIIRRPEAVDGTGLPRVQPQPWLPLATPVQQANRPGVEGPAIALEVVASKSMLVPPVFNILDVAGEDQQERRQRAQLVYPGVPLDHHPILDLPGVPTFPPLLNIHDHDAGVEVAGLPAMEGPRKLGVQPEGIGEVVGEICMAVLRRAQHLVPQLHFPQFGNVIDHHKVGVQVDDPPDIRPQDVGEVDPRIVERLVQRLADRRRDLATDQARVEAVELEVQVGEGGPHALVQLLLSARGEEVERQVLGARRVLEDRQHGGDGAPEVVGVESHRDVDALGGTILAIAENGRLAEGGEGGGSSGGGGGWSQAVGVDGGDGRAEEEE